MVLQTDSLTAILFNIIMSDSEGTSTSRTSSNPQSQRLSPSTSRELKQVMNQTVSVDFDRPIKSEDIDIFPAGDTSGLTGEALRDFKRRRNAFHSRKKRRRKKEFLERLQVCFERVSSENQRLKRDHSFLHSTVGHALQMVQRLEAAQQLETRRSLPGRNLFPINPTTTQGYPSMSMSIPYQTQLIRSHEYLDPSVAAVAAAVRQQEQSDAARRAAALMQVAQVESTIPNPFRSFSQTSFSPQSLGTGNHFVPFAETQGAVWAQQQSLQSALDAESQLRLQLLASLNRQQHSPYVSMFAGPQHPFTSNTAGAGAFPPLNPGPMNQHTVTRNDSNSSVPADEKFTGEAKKKRGS